MKYLFSNSIKNIARQKKAYFLFSLEIFLSVTVMLVFGSISSSLNRDYNRLKRDNTSKTIYLYLLPQWGSEFIGKDLSFTYDDYLWIKEKYGDVLSPCYMLRHNFLTSLDDNIEFVFGLFVTDEYFVNCYEGRGMDNFSDQKLILTPSRINDMTDYTNETEIFSMKYFLENSGRGYLQKDIKEISNGGKDIVYTFPLFSYSENAESSAPLSEVMIAPISLYNEEWQHTESRDTDMLTLNFNGKTDPAVLRDIREHLSEVHSGGAVNCSCASPLTSFEEYAKGQITLANVLQALSAAAAVITGVGFAGLILIIFNNRKKRLAVALVTGADYSKLYGEMIIEIETVIAAGVLMGEIIGFIGIMLLDVNFSFCDFTLSPSLAIGLPAAFITAGILISLGALYKLVKMEPNEILKKD